MEPPVQLRNSTGLLLACVMLTSQNPASLRHIVRGDQACIHTAQSVTYVDGEPFTGILVRLQINQKDTLRIQEFQNGQEHGILKQFYPDGKPELIRYFKAGKKDGLFEAWWPNGRKRLHYTFTAGDYEGEGNEWALNGQLIKRMHYVQGQEAGLQQQWTESGDIWANYEVREGKRYGIIGVKSCATSWKRNNVSVH